MRNFTLLIIIFLACSSYSFSQDFNFSREVEAKVAANHKAGLAGFTDVFLNFEMEVFGLKKAQDANNFDLNLMRKYSKEIVSSNTINVNGKRVCYMQTFGDITSDRIREIMLNNHAFFESFERVYTLEKVIVPESRFTEVEKFEISKAKFDALPDNEKQDILNQTKKYTIVE
jgi:hypothetical protein